MKKKIEQLNETEYKNSNENYRIMNEKDSTIMNEIYAATCSLKYVSIS